MKLAPNHGRSLLALFLAAPLLPALASCSSDDGLTGAEAQGVVDTYGDILFAAYDDSIRGAEALEAAITAFLEEPTQSNLDAARVAWIASRPSYLETEVARFYEGPIDDPETGPEGLINSWPLDEAFIDYVEGDDTAGLINHPEELETIDAETLAAENQVGGDEQVSVGYHAIEFLLWGQDQSADGPGARSFEDYVEGGDATNVERRRDYLAALTPLLLEHLAHVRDAWDAESGAYRTEMYETAATDPKDAVGRIIIGMGNLSSGELAQERMNVAYETRDQEDEHSCFSDTTHQDQLHDAIGIRNVYLGTYTRTDGTVVEGPSLSDLVAARDPELDTKLREQLDHTIELIGEVPAPFDQAIIDDDGRDALKAAIDALREQGNTISDVAALFDIQINLE